MVTVNVAVMDYCTGCIKMYYIEMHEGWQCDEVEEWLYEHTDYKDSQCYYMAQEGEIEVVYPEVD